MMLTRPAHTAPIDSQLTGIYGLTGRVHWPTALARTALRGLVLWPVIAFVGGTRGVRGAMTALVGGAAYTVVEMAFDATGAANAAASVLSSSAAPGTLPNGVPTQPAPADMMPNGMGRVIDAAQGGVW